MYFMNASTHSVIIANQIQDLHRLFKTMHPAYCTMQMVHGDGESVPETPKYAKVSRETREVPKQ